MKNVFIVLAHPEPGSFNNALAQEARRALSAQGCSVVVSDLYSMKFNPLVSRNDITGEPQNPDDFHVAIELGQATLEGRLAPDILAEQQKVNASDLVIFQFPLYWIGYPAILKGWFDRILTENFAFQLTQPDAPCLNDQGCLKGKKAVLSLTTGAHDGWFTDRSPFGDMEVILWPLQAVVRFAGFDVLAPHVLFAPEFVDVSVRKGMLEKWNKRLQNIWEEKCLSFIPMSSYRPTVPGHPEKGLVLKEEFLEKEKDNPYGPTVGQNNGKALPRGSMLLVPLIADSL